MTTASPSSLSDDRRVTGEGPACRTRLAVLVGATALPIRPRRLPLAGKALRSPPGIPSNPRIPGVGQEPRSLRSGCGNAIHRIADECPSRPSCPAPLRLRPTGDKPDPTVGGWSDRARPTAKALRGSAFSAVALLRGWRLLRNSTRYVAPAHCVPTGGAADSLALVAEGGRPTGSYGNSVSFVVIGSAPTSPTNAGALPTVGGWSEGRLARPCSTDSHSARDAPESILRLLRARSSPHWFARWLARSARSRPSCVLRSPRSPSSSASRRTFGSTQAGTGAGHASHRRPAVSAMRSLIALCRLLPRRIRSLRSLRAGD